MLSVMISFLTFARGHSDFAPSRPGPYRVAKFDVGTRQNPAIGPWHLSVIFPTTPTSPGKIFPVLLFVTGLAGENALTAYSDVLNRTASHGVVVVGVDRKTPLLPTLNYTFLDQELGGVLDFIGNGALIEQLAINKAAGVAHTSRIVFGGHSAGNHVLVHRLSSFGCGSGVADVGGMVMIDPVDGADPYGMIDEFVIHPPTLVKFTTPALHIEASLDPVPALPSMPACAPKNIGNARFYNAWRGPIWQMTAVDMGHMDVQDEGGAGAMGRMICAHNRNAADRQRYRTTVAETVAAFVRGLVLWDLGSTAKESLIHRY